MGLFLSAEQLQPGLTHWSYRLAAYVRIMNPAMYKSKSSLVLFWNVWVIGSCYDFLSIEVFPGYWNITLLFIHIH